MSSFSYLDYSLVAVYFAFLGFLGWGFSGKKNAPALEYFAMGRQLSLPLFVGTLVSTWYGELAGVSEWSFTYGIYNWLTQGFFWYLTYLLYAFFLVEKFHHFKSLTLSQYFRPFFGKAFATLIAVISFFKMLPIIYLLSLALLVKTLLPLELPSCLFLAAILSLYYCLFGGYKSVVLTDCFQMLCMYTGIILVPLCAYAKYGGLFFLKQHLPPEHFSFTAGFPWHKVFVWLLIPLSTLFNPTFYQRIQTAKSPEVAKKGIALAIVCWFFFDLCTTLIGLYARALNPELEPAGALVQTGLMLLPSGLKGIFFIALLATVMSTLDSQVFVGSQIVAQDLMPRRFLKNSVAVSRWAMLGITLLALLWNLFLPPPIMLFKKIKGSLLASCLLIPTLHVLYRSQLSSPYQGFFPLVGGLIGYVLGEFFMAGKIGELDGLYLGLTLSLVAYFLSFFFPYFLRKTTQ